MTACARCKTPYGGEEPLGYGYAWIDEKVRPGVSFCGTRTVWMSGWLCAACLKKVSAALDYFMHREPRKP